MKVLLLNGSPRAKGNTYLALEEMAKVFETQGIESEIVQVGNQGVRGCMACGYCHDHGKCVIQDVVNDLARKFEQCDGLVVGTPVYYGLANGNLISALDRLFYSSKCDPRMKVGASVVVARRGGSSATYDELNKYFGITGMPIATSQYWNMAYGAAAQEVNQDQEGMQTMRTLANNMVFLMKSIALGKEAFGLPETEERVYTNFIR